MTFHLLIIKILSIISDQILHQCVYMCMYICIYVYLCVCMCACSFCVNYNKQMHYPYPIWLAELEDGSFSSALQDFNHYLHPYLPHNFEPYAQKNTTICEGGLSRQSIKNHFPRQIRTDYF